MEEKTDKPEIYISKDEQALEFLEKDSHKYSLKFPSEFPEQHYKIYKLFIKAFKIDNDMSELYLRENIDKAIFEELVLINKNLFLKKEFGNNCIFEDVLNILINSIISNHFIKFDIQRLIII